MGWMDIKGIGTWGDDSQDLVDNYLKSYGYNFQKKYTKKQLTAFYNKAARDKSLASGFQDNFQENLERNPKRKELLYHIRFGLGMLNISHPFDDKMKRG